MARKNKRKVDYFPHYTNHGETIFILESKFGNDGYAFLFKLFELLGRTDGHCLDISTVQKREFLSAKMHIEWDKCKHIFDLLLQLKKIDKELYEKNHIWYQNFVDNLEDLYKRRLVDLPKKPINVDINPVKGEINVGINPINVDISTQSKVKYSKVNKSKEKNTPPDSKESDLYKSLFNRIKNYFYNHELSKSFFQLNNKTAEKKVWQIEIPKIKELIDMAFKELPKDSIEKDYEIFLNKFILGFHDLVTDKTHFMGKQEGIQFKPSHLMSKKIFPYLVEYINRKGKA